MSQNKLGKIVGRPKRIIALFLSLVLLLSVCFPLGMKTIQANERGDGVVAGEEVESDTTKVEDGSAASEVAQTADELYEKLMSCETYDELSDVMDNMTEEEYELMEQFTDEQNAALAARIEELQENETDALAGGGGGPGGSGGGNDDDEDSGTGSSSGSTEIDPSKYDGTIDIYWDTTTELSTSATTAGGANVTSVYLNSNAVIYANSTTTGSALSGGGVLSTYFPGATAGSGSTDYSGMTSSTLSITAATGYYVTGVVVGCVPADGATVYNCSTWKAGNEFIQTFDLSNSSYANGVYTLNYSISSSAFSHGNASAPNAYFILITVAAVPTPLYVEYNYGIASAFKSATDSVFDDPDSWTEVANDNSYGTGGGILTSDTQFKYAYSSTEEVASWAHTANAVSDAALAEAAAAGYYFAGWAVTWYNDCSVTNAEDSYGNNCTMSFDDTYMEGTIQPGASVQLPTHVQLVAQWEPIQLKVTKTVSGLSSLTEFSDKEQTYMILLLNLQSGEYVTLQTKGYTITGDGTLTYSFGVADSDVAQVIAPGTYKVVETGNYDLTGTGTNAYCTISYPVETVTVAADGTIQELQVLNTYTDEPATYSVSVKKTISGNMANENEEFTFVVVYGETTETLTLKAGETGMVSDIPVGEEVTVTESATGYTYSLTSIMPIDLEYTELIDGNGLSFIMPSGNVIIEVNNEKEITIDTGIGLDSIPYIVILAIAIVGGVFLFVHKRKNKDEI